MKNDVGHRETMSDEEMDKRRVTRHDAARMTKGSKGAKARKAYE